MNCGILSNSRENIQSKFVPLTMSMAMSQEDFFSSKIYEDDVIYFKETISDVWHNCVLESLKSVAPILSKLIVSNFLFGFATSVESLPEKYFHILSGITGIFLLTTLESTTGKLVLCLCFISSYILIELSDLLHKLTNIRQGNFTKVILITALILSEYFLVAPDIWLQIRGVIMILSMKVISLSHDYETSKWRLNKLEYFGYTFCCGNILFGPWISYTEYYNLCVNPTKKNLWWIWGMIRALIVASLFLTVSNCWASHFISDDYNRWLVAYREAFSFRTSHYFICYLSEASMLSAGFKNTKSWYEVNQWNYTVANPLDIEIPSALATVVTSWNRPMHEFLKKFNCFVWINICTISVMMYIFVIFIIQLFVKPYRSGNMIQISYTLQYENINSCQDVYRSWLPYGKFAAIFATFVMSSFLHGFELKVSVVLITIGIFSYLQVIPRDFIADIAGCCVRVRPCKNCNHLYKRDSWRARAINSIYSAFTVLHLIYLGILMDSSTNEDLFQWRNELKISLKKSIKEFENNKWKNVIKYCKL